MPKPSSFETAFDSNNNFPVTQGTRLAGEDLTNDVIKTEQRFSYSVVNSAATTVVKSGSGFFHGMIITNAGATSNTIKIYDNIAASGTVILDFSTSGGVPVVGGYIVDVAFTTGLTIVTAGTTSPVLTVSYR